MMEVKERFLLYIDFLGFSDMVKHKPSRVRELFNIINQLNVHYHEAFKTIIFSDTILVYNMDYAICSEDEDYYVMFLIEFVEDLFYRIANKNFVFRAFIVKGEFEFNELKNFQQYFGKALLKAYNSEKNFPYIGLFIDEKSNKNNKVFTTKKITKDYSYVFINQSLDHYCQNFNEFPIDKSIAEEDCLIENISADILYLKSLFLLSQLSIDTKIVEKTRNTLKIYKQQFPEFYNECLKHNFDIKLLGNYVNKKHVINVLNSGYNGFKGKNQTTSELKQLLKKARDEGIKAANLEISKNPNNYFLPCGLIALMINIDERSHFFRQLKECENDTSLKFEIHKYMDGYRIYFNDLHESQFLSVDKAAYEAIKKELEKNLNVPLYIKEILD